MPTDFGNVCLLSALSRRATVALFHQVTAWKRSAGAAAHCSMWSQCLRFIVAYFARRMHWFTLFEDYYKNDETFNVCKFWKWDSEWNKVVFFGESQVFSVCFFTVLNTLQLSTQVYLHNTDFTAWIRLIFELNSRCHFCNCMHNVMFFFNLHWTILNVLKLHDQSENYKVNPAGINLPGGQIMTRLNVPTIHLQTSFNAKGEPWGCVMRPMRKWEKSQFFEFLQSMFSAHHALSMYLYCLHVHIKYIHSRLHMAALMYAQRQSYYLNQY